MTEPLRPNMKPALSAPFLVPASLYLIATAYLVVFGIGRLMELIPLLQKIGNLPPAKILPIVEAYGVWLFRILIYLSLSALLVTRSKRPLALILAAISCVLLPIGTILGATVLLWTRRHWPKPEQAHSDQTALP